VAKQAGVIAQREDEKDLADSDEIEILRLDSDIEEMQRRRDAESIEHNQSRAQLPLSLRRGSWIAFL